MAEGTFARYLVERVFGRELGRMVLCSRYVIGFRLSEARRVMVAILSPGNDRGRLRLARA
jgi:hypothetical protein